MGDLPARPWGLPKQRPQPHLRPQCTEARPPPPAPPRPDSGIPPAAATTTSFDNFVPPDRGLRAGIVPLVDLRKPAPLSICGHGLAQGLTQGHWDGLAHGHGHGHGQGLAHGHEQGRGRGMHMGVGLRMGMGMGMGKGWRKGMGKGTDENAVVVLVTLQG